MDILVFIYWKLQNVSLNHMPNVSLIQTSSGPRLRISEVPLYCESTTHIKNLRKLLRDISNENRFVKYRGLENNQLYRVSVLLFNIVGRK